LKEIPDKRANNGNEYIPIKLKVAGKQGKGMVEILSFTARDEEAVDEWLEQTSLKTCDVNPL
jgi:hypothetical protein